MKKNTRMLIAGLAIYEVLLITFVLIAEPYGGRMRESEWINFWSWVFIVPIAVCIIYYLVNWALNKK